jgi:hypothetical protein
MICTDFFVYTLKGSGYFLSTLESSRISDVLGYTAVIAIPAFILGVACMITYQHLFKQRDLDPDGWFFSWAFVTGFGISALFAIDYFLHEPVTDSRLAPLLIGGWLPTVVSALGFVLFKKK